jgi:hypothetical protein
VTRRSSGALTYSGSVHIVACDMMGQLIPLAMRPSSTGTIGGCPYVVVNKISGCGGLYRVPSRSMANRTSQRRRASAMRAWLWRFP